MNAKNLLRSLTASWPLLATLLTFTVACSTTPAPAPPNTSPSAASRPADEAGEASDPVEGPTTAKPEMKPETSSSETADSEVTTEGKPAGEATGALAPLPPMPVIEELEIASGTDPDEPVSEESAGADPEGAESPAEEKDSAALLEASLEAFESSEVFWQQGNFEDAFAALDQAYELMASVSSNGDPVLAQQKEDLRHLISRRVVEIYASRQTAVGSPNGSIPVEITDDVRREIASFQGPERDFFLESYRRSGLYRPMILEELHRAGLPEQLSWLPLVESGFKVRAFSRARALGLWQFISSTGYRYGLERTWWVDERMDPLKATRAALAYLTNLHNLFGDWMTALAAYNCGERAVLRQIQNQPVSYFDRFWDLYARLPRETRRYVPRFLAVLAILEDPEAYGFELPEPLPPLRFEKLEVERAVELEALDQALSLDKGTLTTLNPELRRGGTPDEPYTLRVPAGQAEVARAKLEELPEWAPAGGVGVHRVRRGETLSGVAATYGTTVRALMDLNRLRSPHRIWPGQQLQIPGGGGRSRALAPGSEVTHRVRRGDSLWRLARQYGTTVSRIKRDNGLRSNLLRPGQTLKIRGGASKTYTVRRGDTLGKIARSHGVSLNRLLQANRLSRRSTIYPGQVLAIP